ncbi:translation initiation factor IF-2 N-terminal domain-containing protein [Corynebacterium breve]|uniref:Translation initiation factor IF-2 N-terminal domain-containing protein n=1 Tax=Corynebacterium breve TaxID=3049799 RepID=A0ABY8VEV2_9CORY|nr:translation initiation factor IF-2 N-terminal domain-containing protein [Corynebacterium breve]WIM67163.1 translation initiation factor IF-2 N-terminal domain-containing protein [Corynebacterium breve]
MADASEKQETNDNSSTPERKSKRATKKTAKKSAKKTAKKASQPAQETALGSNSIATFDRSKLTDKTRVFALAKELDLPSKDLVIALNSVGVVKVAQSTLTRAEAEQLLDVLQGVAADPKVNTVAPADVAAEADEKIRQRVRKDVANEIHQIEEKVEADLASALDDEPLDDDAPADDVPTEEVPAEDSVEPVAFEANLSPDHEPLIDITPDVTPAPAEETAAESHAPLFKAPSNRRRARRVTEPAKTQAEQNDEFDGSSSSKLDRDNRSQTNDAPAEELYDEQDDAVQEPVAIKGSSRLEAQRRRRSEKRAEGRKRSRIVSQAEFLARRESVERTMVVRERERHDHHGMITQVGVLEDGLLVEHFVTSEENTSMIGNIYLGRVQNVLPSMEAAFIDIGQGRNGVLYAGEVDWKSAGLGGRSRKIEHALKSGDQVVVQVTKDPLGHKGARLTTQISLAGRYLVYVPGGRSAGISRKLPAPERKRLKEILNNVVPGKGGAIIRTAAEGVPEEAIAADVNRLHVQWETIQEQAAKEKASKGAKPVTLYEEPNMLVKVIRDLFNEDFSELVVDGKRSWNIVNNYVTSVAPDLADRLVKYNRAEHGGNDAFEEHRVEEQLQKALSRKVWLPSGGSLVIDRTEAMTVIDVNTGKFTGSGGSLEETLTSNNLEAAEEIVRQLRLRDIGGMIVIDFIDMILPENQDLVLRRLKEALGRDRTRHQVSEVTSLGLVQLTRKRLGTGLLETFSTECEHCNGRGIIIWDDPVEHEPETHEPPRKRRKPAQTPGEHPAAKAMHTRDDDQDLAPETDAEEAHDVAAVAGVVEKDFEALAASVVAFVDNDSEDDAGDIVEDTVSENASENAGEEKRSASRRRGRRGRGRGRGKPAAEQAATNKDAAGQAEEEQTPQSGEKTYEEAVAEFENSPRRKRRTRGNSRSDHRPREEDFVAQVDQPAEDSVDELVVDKPADPIAEALVEKIIDERLTGSGRGRRRAVRRARTSQVKAPSVDEKTESAHDAQKEPKKKSVASSTPASSSSRGRGRRRATRRTSQA